MLKVYSLSCPDSGSWFLSAKHSHAGIGEDLMGFFKVQACSNVTTPGRIRSNGWLLYGGIVTRNAVRNVQLATQMPGIAGCGGIDLWMGDFLILN